MKKSDRIEALEGDLDVLAQRVDKLAARVKALEAPPEVTPGRSLGAIALDELRYKRDTLLETLGIRL